jgi:hypothetical protein
LAVTGERQHQAEKIDGKEQQKNRSKEKGGSGFIFHDKPEPTTISRI